LKDKDIMMNLDICRPSAKIRQMLMGACLVALPCVLLSPADASVLLYNGSSLSGVDGLVVDNNSYNVNFVLDTYNDVFAATPPLFLNNASLATDAASSLLTIFSSNSISNVAGVAGGGGISVVVPYQAPDNSGNFLGVQDVYNITLSNAWAVFGGSPAISDNLTYGHNVLAVFAAVPEPATWAVMLAGLICLTGFGRYRRRKRAGAGLAA